MSRIDNPDLPQFLAADACRAAGINAATFKNWTNRSFGVIELTDFDRPAQAAGQPHLLSFRRVMQIVLTAKLVQLGVKLSKAAGCVLDWTDVGDAVGYYADEPMPPLRFPCQHYASGETYLVVRADEDRGKIVNIKTSADIPRLFSNGDQPIAAAVVVVNIAKVELDVRAALELPLRLNRMAQG